MKHSDLERLLAEEGQELMRQVYQACLDQRAQAEVNDEVVDAQGKRRTCKRTQRRALEPIFGTVEVGRTGYGAEGEASLHPLDAQLTLPAERMRPLRKPYTTAKKETAMNAPKGIRDPYQLDDSDMPKVTSHPRGIPLFNANSGEMLPLQSYHRRPVTGIVALHKYRRATDTCRISQRAIFFGKMQETYVLLSEHALMSSPCLD